MINHTLNYTPSVVLYSGRMETYYLSDIFQTSVTVIPKLLTTSLVNPPVNALAVQLTFADVALFRKGDLIQIGEVQRKIASIVGNVVTFDNSFLCGTVYSVSLAEDTANIVIF